MSRDTVTRNGHKQTMPRKKSGNGNREDEGLMIGRIFQPEVQTRKEVERSVRVRKEDKNEKQDGYIFTHSREGNTKYGDKTLT